MLGALTMSLGIFGGLAILALAVLLTADAPGLFLNGPGAVVVVGGTLAATLLSYSPRDIGAALRAFFDSLRGDHGERADLDEIIRVARAWHRGNIHEAERRANAIPHPFLRTGLQMTVDTMPLNDILSVLDWRMARLQAREQAEADVFQAMAGYAPAFGMVGTLLGLVNLLDNLENAGVSNIAFDLAVALVTTFYGLILANAVFKPMAIKLRRRTRDRLHLLHLIKQAIVLVSRDRSPTQIRYALEAFLSDGERHAVDDADEADDAGGDGGHGR